MYQFSPADPKATMRFVAFGLLSPLGSLPGKSE